MNKPVCDTQGTCPLWKKPLKQVCHKCHWFIHVRGNHPQTGAEIDVWDCAMAMMPMLSIENSLIQRQTGASVDALRNEVVQTSNRQMVAGIMNTKALLNGGGQS